MAEGFIETLLVYAPDRLSRKYAIQFQGVIAEYKRAQIAERTRRGKRHLLKQDVSTCFQERRMTIDIVRKSDAAEAYYAVIEAEAEVVREVFELYTEELWSIGAIGRHLNQRGVWTQCNRGPWKRCRNPGIRARSVIGKTERVTRQKITKPLRQKGGFSTRSSTRRERNAQEWISVRFLRWSAKISLPWPGTIS